MGLDSFISDEQKSWHDNSKIDKRKLHDDEQCPSCGSKGEKKKYYYRCTASKNECEVVTYIPA